MKAIDLTKAKPGDKVTLRGLNNDGPTLEVDKISDGTVFLSIADKRNVVEPLIEEAMSQGLYGGVLSDTYLSFGVISVYATGYFLSEEVPGPLDAIKLETA